VKPADGTSHVSRINANGNVIVTSADQIARGDMDVAIQDGSGKSIRGAELAACCRGEKTLTPDLRAISN